MADLPIDQLDDFEKALEEIVRTGHMTADDFKRLTKESGLLEKAMKKSIQSVKAVGSTMSNFTHGVAGGNTSMTQFGSALNNAADAVANLASGIPILGGAVKGVAKAAEVAISRLEVSFKSFEDLSKVGLIGAQGISGFRDQMVQTGIPMENLAKILESTAGDLQFFSGSALEGGKTMSRVLGQMQHGQGMTLRRLGFSIDEIGDTIADFQKTNRILGIRQTMSTDEITKSTNEYGKQLDWIAKLTGESRKELQKHRDALMADNQYSAWVTANTTKRNEKQMLAVTDFVGQIKRLAPTMGEGIKTMFATGGVATNEASQRLVQQGMGPAVMEIRKKLMSGQIDVAGAQRQLFKAALANRDKFQSLSALLGDFGSGIPFAEMNKLAQSMGLSDKEIKSLHKAQNKQVGGSDKLTDQLTQTVMNLQKTQVSLDQMFTSATGAASAVNFMSKTMYKFANFVNEHIIGENAAAGKAREEQFDVGIKAQRLGIKEKGTVVGAGEAAHFEYSQRTVGKYALEKERMEKEYNDAVKKGEQTRIAAAKKRMEKAQKDYDFIAKHAERNVGEGGASYMNMAFSPYMQDRYFKGRGMEAFREQYKLQNATESEMALMGFQMRQQKTPSINFSAFGGEAKVANPQLSEFLKLSGPGRQQAGEKFAAYQSAMIEFGREKEAFLKANKGKMTEQEAQHLQQQLDLAADIAQGLRDLKATQEAMLTQLEQSRKLLNQSVTH